MFFRSTTHASVSRTALRAAAAAFAVGIIGAGLVTAGASVESEELSYQCSTEGDDDAYQVWFTFETDAPQSADENEEFRIDPVSADVRMAPETWGHFLAEGEEGYILGDFTFTINVLPAGTSPGDDGTSDQDVTMNSTFRGSYPDPGDAFNFGIETPEGTKLPSKGFGTNELQYTAGDGTITLLDNEGNEATSLSCELVSGDPLIDTVALNSSGGGSDD